MFNLSRYLKITFLQGYISTMKHFALGKIAEKKPWFVIDFCQLGFIGKMFKSVELPWLVNFFLMFYNDKPGTICQSLYMDFLYIFYFLNHIRGDFNKSVGSNIRK